MLQVATVALLSPLLTGFIAKVEAWVQSRRGPSMLQPYRDLAKLFRKGMTVPVTAGLGYMAGPVVAVAAYLTVPLLIPVLTGFPLPLATMADVLGGAFVLTLAGIAVAVAATDSGAVYAGLGGSRAMTFGALAEPTLVFVFFTIALLTRTDNPFVLNQSLQGALGQWFRASHLLASAGFFMMLLLETGRIPIESASSTLEFGMIDDARALEHSGPLFGLLRWGGMMKQLILYVIFLNVLVAPWGVAMHPDVPSVVLSLVFLALKMAVLGLVVVVIESAFAKLRLFRITEFMGAGFVLAVLAILVFYVGGFWMIPSVPVAITGLALVAVLLTQFAILRLAQLEPIVRVYLVQSLAVCLFTGLAGWQAGSYDLFGLAALTFVTKVVVIPILVGAVVRRLGVEDRVPLMIPIPLTFLIGAALAAFGFFAAANLHQSSMITAGVGVGLASLLIGFLFIVARPNAVAQLIGFLTLENAVFVASLTLAPGLPILVAVLLLLDVLIPAVAFVLVIRVLIGRVRSVHTTELTELRG